MRLTPLASGKCHNLRVGTFPSFPSKLPGAEATNALDLTARGYLTRQKIVKGFQTGDFVKATILTGKFKGTHQGRLAVRARGSFVIQSSAGNVETSWKHCKRLMRNDGYTYEIKPPAIPPLPKGGGSLA
jgi:hypothetical protein